MNQVSAGRTGYTARKDGRTVAVLALTDDGVTVESAVYPRSKDSPVAAGPYRFAAPAEARAFLEEAVEALTYLGCEIV